MLLLQEKNVKIKNFAAEKYNTITTIKDALRELVASQLLEKIPQGRGRPNYLHLLFPVEEVRRKSDGGYLTGVGQKTVVNYGGISPPW